MLLDIAVARAVARAKLLERAVHDSGPWEIEINGMRFPAVKVKSDVRVLFLTHIPQMCFVTAPEFAQLYCRGELVGSRQIITPLEGSYSIQWALSVDEPSPISV